MPKYKVLVTDHVFENFDGEKAALESVDAELVIRQAKTPGELTEDVRDADAILNTYLGPIDKALFSVAEKLKIVARYGIGVDTINVADATDRGIMVTNVPDYCVNEVADHALALFLTLARKTAFSDRKIRAGEWSLSYVKPMKAIQGMTVGIVGFGRIGREIAQRVLTFGVQVVFADPFVSEPLEGTVQVDLETLLESSDAIFIQCPSTDETHHLLNQDAFARMKAMPLVINTARGPIVDTDAVVWALKNNRIAGVALDVLEDEEAVVKQDHPLKAFDNVILTPHSAWFSDRAIPQLQRLAAEEVARVLRGERPKSLINPEVWKG